MPQFDVHRNPGRGRADIPSVVALQSDVYDHVRTRLVAPPVAAGIHDPWKDPAPLPRFTVEGQRVVLDPLLMQPVPRTALGPVIASLADDNSAVGIITAIDEILPRTRR